MYFGYDRDGRIGTETWGDIAELTKLEFSAGAEIEVLGETEYTHSALVDTNGYVWTSGMNDYGQLGIDDYENKDKFQKIGKDILETNFDKIAVEIGESKEIFPRIKNNINLKNKAVDDNPESFYLEIISGTNISANKLTVTGNSHGESKIKVIHKETKLEKELTVACARRIESIVQEFKDNDYSDGEYWVLVEEQGYLIELVNYYDDMRYSLTGQETEKVVGLGDNSKEYKTLVVKYHGNLTVDRGVTLTANTVNDLTYKKGMYVCVLRKC